MPPKITLCRCCIDHFPTYILCILLIFWSVIYIIVYCYWNLIEFHEDLALGIAFIVIYCIFLIMYIWSYFETMCQDQAEVPDQYRFNEMDSNRIEGCDIERMEEALRSVIALRGITVVTRLANMRIRYCRYCHLLKPDRTHHCATCQTCSMKMDHHCPWISNCIAFYNYKQFLLTQFYGVLLTLWIVITVGINISQLFDGFYDHILIAVVMITAAVALIFFLVMLIFHLILLSRNETTLENRYEVKFVNLGLYFNVGCCMNCREVCGDNCCCWLCPIFSSKGNGCEFPVCGPSTNWEVVEPKSL